MIEAIVVMVLVGMMLAGAGIMLVRSFSESGSAIQQRQAIEQARTTANQLGNDLRATRSPDRDPRIVGNSNDLAGALFGTSPVKRRMPGENELRTLDVRDVVEATATSLTVRADADPRPGVECVRYFVDPVSRSLVRSVLVYDQRLRTCPMRPELSRNVLVAEVAS
ncbi:MAG: hypothetical protein KDC46_04555 [Thermoleophilia bacterium]|nr:hypothetical protein [Thermoleophilia bacterium]